MAIPLPTLGERKYLQLWEFNKKRNLKFWQPCCQNLEIGAHKERELVEGGENLVVIVFCSNIIISIDAFRILYNPYIIIVISSPKSL